MSSAREFRTELVSAIARDPCPISVVSAPVGYAKSALASALAGRMGARLIDLAALGSAEALTALRDLPRRPGSSAYVIDGAETIDTTTSGFSCDTLRRLAETNVRLVLAGRGLAYRLGLEPLIASGQARLWAAEDLALDAGEIASLFERAGAPLASTDAARVEGWCDGWPLAAVQCLYVWRRRGDAALRSLIEQGPPFEVTGLLDGVVRHEMLRELTVSELELATRAALLETLDPAALEAATGGRAARTRLILSQHELLIGAPPGEVRILRAARDHLRVHARLQLGEHAWRDAHLACAHALRDRMPQRALGHLAAAEEWPAYLDLLMDRHAMPALRDTRSAANAFDLIPRRILRTHPKAQATRLYMACLLGEIVTVNELLPGVRAEGSQRVLEYNVDVMRGDLGSAGQVLERVHADSQTWPWYWVLRSELALRSGSVVEAVGHAERALARAEAALHGANERATHLQRRQARAYAALCYLRSGALDTCEALALAEREGRDANDQIGDRTDLVGICAAGLRGKPVDLVLVDAALERQERSGAPQTFGAFLELAIAAGLLAGDQARLERCAAQLRGLAERLVSPHARTDAHALLALLAFVAGDAESARTEGALAMRATVPGGAALAATVLVTKDTPSAVRGAREREHAGAPLEAALVLLAAAEVAALPDERDAALREACGLLQRCGARAPWPPLPLGMGGTVDAYASGRLSEAEALVRAFPRVSLPLLSRHIRTNAPTTSEAMCLFVGLGGRKSVIRALSRRPGPLRLAALAALGQVERQPDGRGLPTRLREVLALLSEGASNKAIARSLGVSERTAANHVARLSRRFGASTRGEIVARSEGLGAHQDQTRTRTRSAG